MLTAGVGFKWEIFDGKEGKHAEELAKVNKEMLQTQKYDATRKLTLNLANNQSNYDIAYAQIALKKKQKNWHRMHWFRLRKNSATEWQNLHS